MEKYYEVDGVEFEHDSKVSDITIYEKVCSALSYDPRIDASSIEVYVEDGIVKLKGEVGRRGIKRLAERIIKNIPGIIEIQNQIKLKRVSIYSDETLTLEDVYGERANARLKH